MGRNLLFFLVVGGIVFWIQQQKAPSLGHGQNTDRIEYASFASEGESNVVLYATAWCGYCRKTRRFLKDNDIDYFEFDIESSSLGAKEYRRLNGKGVPLLVVNSEVIRGYNPPAIMAALNRSNPSSND